jgi:hypothetical protein
LAVGVGAAGYGLGILVNRIPVGGGDTVGTAVSNSFFDLFFSSQADNTRNFVNRKITTVLSHIGSYPPPNSEDPNDQSWKKNIGDRMRKHLEAARNRLKRLPKRQLEEYEELIRRTEEQLERWISGHPL